MSACSLCRPYSQEKHYQWVIQIVFGWLRNEDRFHALLLVSWLHVHEENAWLMRALYVMRSKWASSSSASTPGRLPPISISVPGICPPSFNSTLIIPKGMFD